MPLLTPPHALRFAPPRRRRGFTLIELLAVIAIIGILAALTVTAVLRTRGMAHSARCQSNLRQIFVAFSVYATDHRRAYPKASANWGSGGNYWYSTLLGHGQTADLIDEENGLRDGSAGVNYLQSRDVLTCPSPGLHANRNNVGTHITVSYGMTSLPLWSSGFTGRTSDHPRFFLDNLKTPARWPLVMDARYSQVLSLDNPQEDTANAYDTFDARHGGQANVLMADGHLERIRYGDTRWNQSNLNRSGLY